MFYLDKDNVFKSTKLPSSLYHGFGTRQANIEKIFADNLRVIRPKQLHSDIIHTIEIPINRYEGDGLYTDKKNVVLTVQTADCVPIIFADVNKKIIGISHQGWKGSLLQLPQKMIQNFNDLKSNIYDLTVVIGPSIGACCYKIWGERKTQFEKEFSEISNQIIETRSDGSYLNLLRLNYMLLISSGVKKENIDYFPFCTKCDREKFYSYSRNDIASEMVNFIYMT